MSERYASDSETYSNAFLQQSRQASQRTDHVTAQVDLPAWHRQLWQFGADLHRESLSQSADGTAELIGGQARRKELAAADAADASGGTAAPTLAR